MLNLIIILVQAITMCPAQGQTSNSWDLCSFYGAYRSLLMGYKILETWMKVGKIMNWIHLARDVVQWRDFAEAIIKDRAAQNSETFFRYLSDKKDSAS